MKISEFITRLEELRTVAEEDVDVAIPRGQTDDQYETALPELQWVIRIPLCDEAWRSREKNNTHQIVVIQ